MKTKKIAVIGGGLSGLLSAYYLTKKGFNVHLFEKEEDLGGELATIKTNGWPIEKFYHHLFLKNDKSLALLKELGLKWKSYESRVGLVRNGSVYNFSNPKDLLRLPYLDLPTKIRLGLSSLLIPRFNYQNFESSTAKSLVSKYVGNKGWEDFWKPFFNLKFGGFSEDISATWFWGRLADRMGTRKGSEKLLYPEGGFHLLLDKLLDEVENEAEIKAGYEVQKIYAEGTKYRIGKECYDQIICAVPYPVFMRLTSEFKSNKNNFVMAQNLGVIVVLLETKKKISDYYWLNILDEDSPFGVLVEHTNMVPTKNYSSHFLYLGRYISTSDSLFKKSDEEITKIFIEGLEKIYPGVREKIKKVHVFRDMDAQPVITVGYKPPKLSYLPNLYLLSSARIYPYDRGIERVIEQVQELIDVI